MKVKFTNLLYRSTFAKPSRDLRLVKIEKSKTLFMAKTNKIIDGTLPVFFS